MSTWKSNILNLLNSPGTILKILFFIGKTGKSTRHLTFLCILSSMSLVDLKRRISFCPGSYAFSFIYLFIKQKCLLPVALHQQLRRKKTNKIKNIECEISLENFFHLDEKFCVEPTPRLRVLWQNLVMEHMPCVIFVLT